MKKYGLVGFPLTHSLSPQIHNYAFHELQIEAYYEKIETQPFDFVRKMLQLKEGGYAGFNVTIPFKGKIIDFLDEIDEDANTISAVNTVVVKNNRWLGYNTDIGGFVHPLLEAKQDLQKCLVLGTGGAARAVIFALSKYIQPKEIIVAGRNTVKGEELSDYFQHLLEYSELRHCLITDLDTNLSGYDLIVNATPLGTYPDIEDSPLPNLINLEEGTIVYDLVYNPLKTKLLSDAESVGKDMVIINGMEMLLVQAARSFELWTETKMPLSKVKMHVIDNMQSPV